MGKKREKKIKKRKKGLVNKCPIARGNSTWNLSQILLIT